jgi:hypothetical protein
MVERSVRIDDRADGKPRTLRLLAAADESLMEAPVSPASTARCGWRWACWAPVWWWRPWCRCSSGWRPAQPAHGAGQGACGDTQRLDGTFPVEIMPLIDEFNTVLAHNAEVVERARTQAGNLAHALKTPLSVLANAGPCQADTGRPPGASGGGAGGRCPPPGGLPPGAGPGRRHARARCQDCVLLPVVDGLVRVMQRIHAERQAQSPWQPMAAVRWRFGARRRTCRKCWATCWTTPASGPAHGSRCGPTPRGPRCASRWMTTARGWRAEQRAAVMRRGVRADEQVPGSGLGLAIVDDLARLYGGRVELLDSPQGGLRAALTLPAVA